MNVAYLIDDSPFAKVFPNGAPIINILAPSRVSLEGSDESEAYMLDLQKCSRWQLDQVVQIASDKFGCKREEIRNQLRERGLPIRKSQVKSVMTDVRIL